MCIFEYDEQENMDVVRAEGWSEGWEKAIEGMVVKLLKDGNLPEESIMEISGVDKEKLNEIKSKYII